MSNNSQKNQNTYRLEDGNKIAVYTLRIALIAVFLLRCIASTLRVIYYQVGQYWSDHGIEWTFTVFLGAFFLALWIVSFTLRNDHAVRSWSVATGIISTLAFVVTIRGLFSTISYIN